MSRILKNVQNAYRGHGSVRVVGDLVEPLLPELADVHEGRVEVLQLAFRDHARAWKAKLKFHEHH